VCLSESARAAKSPEVTAAEPQPEASVNYFR
jgi:hypothetical protein